MCLQHFWGFSLCRPALLGIPTLPLVGRKKDAFQRFNRYQNTNFRCRRDKKLINFNKVKVSAFLTTKNNKI